MSVLAHLAASMGEPGATQALAYILNQQPGVVQAFVNLLGTAGIGFQPRPRVESERGDDGKHILGRPDMKIYDAENEAQDRKPRVLVENKFWAGLTDAQPVGYLEMLREDVSSGLLFIMPKDRVEQMWDVLKTRCQEAGLPLGQASPKTDRVRWVPIGTKTMLITDWHNVLDTLHGAGDGPDIRNDIHQFRRLVEELENIEAFPALRSAEVTNADMARRITNYIDLLQPIRKGLAKSAIAYGPASTSFASRSFHHELTWDNQYGRKVGARLAISFRLWRRFGGISPLWLQINPDTHSHPSKIFEDLKDRLEEEGMYVYSGKYNKYIAIRLKLGVERESVIEDAVEQILRVVRRLT